MSDRQIHSLNKDTEQNEIELGYLFGIALDNRRLIAAITTLCTVAGIFYISLSPLVYKADSLIQVELPVSSNIFGALTDLLPGGKPELSAEIELLKSRMILGNVVSKLNLDIEIKEKTLPLIGSVLARLSGEPPNSLLISKLSVPENFLNQDMVLTVVSARDYSLTAGGNSYRGMVNENLSENGFTILVSEIKAAQGTKFNIRKLDKITTINNLSDELSIQNRAKDNGLLELSLTGQDPTLITTILNYLGEEYLQQNIEKKAKETEKNLSFLQQQLPAIKASLDESEDRLREFKQTNASVDLPLESKSALDLMTSIESQIRALTFKEAEISKLYTKEHPSYKSLLEKKNVLLSDKQAINKKFSSLPQKQQEMLTLSRDVQSEQKVYLLLLSKQQELAIHKASNMEYGRIIDTAVVQPKAITPKKILSLIVSMLSGLMLSAILIFIKTKFNRGIISTVEIEKDGYAVYAAIPAVKAADKTRLLANSLPQDASIEAIRMLRTNLHYALTKANNNIIMIAGITPSAKESFVIANLAAIVAQTGMKVLLIDGDMRKGSLHQLFNCSQKKGLSDLLSSGAAITEVITKGINTNLDLITRGPIPQNPSELLMSANLQNLLSWANNNYDLVIIDAPPVLAITDANIISRHAAISLLSCQYNLTSLSELELSVNSLKQSGSSVSGIILNDIIISSATYYQYGYRSYYEYS